MNTSQKSISVIIPVKNGEATLRNCLESLKAQIKIDGLELIVLDSESTDESKLVSLEFGAKVFTVEGAAFNHGLSRNFGVQHANGDLVYFTVQDALLESTDMLWKMMQHFVDPELKSVTGMQAIPHDPGKNPALWFRRSGKPEPESFQFDPRVFKEMPPSAQMKYCRWDNVNSMYRRNALEEQPFIETNLSEDIVWAKQALEKGWKIMRDPALVVYHYHHHSFGYNFRVNYSVFYADRKFFGLLPAYPSMLRPFLSRTKTLAKEKKISLFKKAGWVVHNMGILLSHFFAVLIFRTIAFFGGKKGVEKSLHLFCPHLPQGKQR